MGKVVGKRFGYAHYAIHFMTLYQLGCRGHVVGDGRDLHVGRCVHLAQQFSAERCAALVDHGYRYFSHNLVGIYIGVEERIGERYKEYEYQYTLVAEYMARLSVPYLEYIQ